MEKEKAKFKAIILAAGRGTRMKSPLPKVLHPVAGQPMIARVIKAAQGAGAEELRIVVGYGEKLVRQVIEPLGAHAYVQSEQKGTGHAVRCADPIGMDGDIMILSGDHPLLQSADLAAIHNEFRASKASLCVVTGKLKNPGSLGRIVRQAGALRAIVEVSDAGPEVLKINEVNAGIYMLRAATLARYLPQIKDDNAKGEFYLTDIVRLCLENNEKVTTYTARSSVLFGVNSQVELARASRVIFNRKRKALMDEGVLMLDPSTSFIEDEVEVASGAVIYPNTFLRGKTQVGSFSVIEPGCFISNSTIGEGVQIRAYSHLESSRVHSKATIGPFARLRPDSEVGEEAHIGNFVELKKTQIGKRSKAGHLTYLGDAVIGEDVNIGCGTITCNYAPDHKKYKTRIGDRTFVGSDTQFVAPIEIGSDVLIGSGSTITKNVPDKALAVARGQQVIKEGYDYAKRAARKSPPVKES